MRKLFLSEQPSNITRRVGRKRAAGGPRGIVTGPDGNLWFTLESTAATAGLDRILVDSPNTIEEFVFSQPTLTYSLDITLGTDGNLSGSKRRLPHGLRRWEYSLAVA